MTISISAETNTWVGPQGMSLHLFNDEDQLVGGWYREAFEFAAEALKAALPNAHVRMDPRCEKESQELWDSVKTISPLNI